MNGKGLWKLITMAALTAVLLALPLIPKGAGTTYAASSKPDTLLKALKTGALATFDVNGERFRVWTTNPQTIEQLKALKAGTSTAHIPNGRILRGPGKAGYNKPWSWHLDPQDVQMADATIEVCDGSPSYVNGHTDEFVDTVKRYCPWGAQLVSLRVIPSAPVAPDGLRVTGVHRGTTSSQQTSLSLKWRDRSNNESGFRIAATFSRMHGGGDGQTWDVGRNATTATVTFVAGGINPVRIACFTVSAVNAAAESSKSNQTCINL